MPQSPKKIEKLITYKTAKVNLGSHFLSSQMKFSSFLDHEEFYDGRVFGEKESAASVHISDGVMTASIHTPEETYHIEVIK